MEQIIKQFEAFQASVEDLKTKLAESETKRQQAEAELQKTREAKVEQPETSVDNLRDEIDPTIPLKDRVAIRNDSINKLEFLEKYGLRVGVYLISKWWGNSTYTDDGILPLIKKNKNLAVSLLPHKWAKIIRTGIFSPKEIVDFIFLYDDKFSYVDKEFLDFQSDEILDYIVEQYKAGKKCPDFMDYIMSKWNIPFSYMLKLNQAGYKFNTWVLRTEKFIRDVIQAKATKEQMDGLFQGFNNVSIPYDDFNKSKYFHALFYYYPDLLEHFSTITLSIAYMLAYSGRRPETMKNNHDEFLRYLAKKLTTDDKIKFCVLLNVNWNEVGFDIKHEPLMKVREEFYAFIKKEFDA